MTKTKSIPHGVHLILQGKGGVGKSFISALLSQFFQEKQVDLTCFDTDPVNQTFKSYKQLNVKHIDLIRDNRINEKSFDTLIEHLLTERRTYVVDNGASSFVPLCSYLDENEIFSVLNDAEIPVYIHCIVTGGQGLLDTMSGFNALAGMTSSKNIVLWKNEFQGEIVVDGKDLEDMKVFIENKDKVYGIVTVKKRNQDTFGDDLQKLLSEKLTFDEGIKSDKFSIMAKQRLKVIQRDIFTQLESLEFCYG